MKDWRIVVPVSEIEHSDTTTQAGEKGFDSVAAYIRWLIRMDKARK